MVATQRGIGFLRSQQEHFGGGGYVGSGFRSFYGITGTQVQFFFLTDAPDIHVPLIHLEQVKRRDNTFFTAERICARNSVDDPEDTCPRCIKGIQGPFPRLTMFVYVEARYWDKQQDTKGKAHPEWEAIPSSDGAVLYKEDLGEVQLFMPRFRLEDQVLELYDGDPMDPDYATRVKTLLGRRMRLVTTGAKQQRQDIIKESRHPLDATPAEVVAAGAALKDLKETVNEEWGDKDSGQNNPRGTANAPQNVAGDGRAVAPPAAADTAAPAEAPTAAASPALEPVDF